MTMYPTTLSARAVAPTDASALLAVIEATGLFGPDEMAEMAALLTDSLNGALGPDHRWAVATASGGEIIGAAYYAPERMTIGTWNLYFIGVHPAHHGTGAGTALLRYVETTLAARGERVLLVETSSTTDFEAPRAFYRRHGYDEEARIREFYNVGDDKVIFRKALAASVVST